MTAITISQPDQDGKIVATTPAYSINIRPRTYWEPMPTGVYVADSIAATADPELARLVADEAALGKRRFSERGVHLDVDDLYDRLNERIAKTKLRIAREALALLGGVVNGDLSEEALNRAYFSRNAGCELCPCSPGVLVPGSLEIGGKIVDIWIEPR
jgi:hypothetical protein